MERHAAAILERIRAAVSRVTERDLSGREADSPLELDSIARIALIAELENEFACELDADAVLPESFETLASLVALIEAQPT